MHVWFSNGDTMLVEDVRNRRAVFRKISKHCRVCSRMDGEPVRVDHVVTFSGDTTCYTQAKMLKNALYGITVMHGISKVYGGV